MRRRVVPATAVFTLLLAGVTACSTPQAQAADCEPVHQPGALSESAQVRGDFGTEPSISLPDDVEIGVTQRSVPIEGEDRSRVVENDTLVAVNLAVLDSLSGEMLEGSENFDSESGSDFVLMTEDSPETPISETLKCAAPGDRVVTVISPEEGAPLAAAYGIEPETPLVAVVDVFEVSPLTASGSERGLPAGFPAVVTDDDGTPGVVLPPSAAPAGTHSATRIVGHGDEVQTEDAVIVRMFPLDWESGTPQGNWDDGPTILQGESEMAAAGATFREELTGETIGSQVVIIDDSSGSPQVMVIDLLRVA